MKRSLFIIIGIFLAINIKAQVQSNCNIPSKLFQAYEEDVKGLALKTIFDTYSPDTSSIIIPQSYQTPIWEGLAAIYNLDSTYCSDSIFDIYCIHNDSHYEGENFKYNYISILIDTNYSWTDNWKILNTTTGISSLDNLLASSGLKVYSKFFNWIDLGTPLLLNLKPICDSLLKYKGILKAEQYRGMGDGNYITYEDWGKYGKYFEFVLGWGDCPSGCLSHRTWKYLVDSNCIVNFLGVNTLSYVPEEIPSYLDIYCNLSASTNIYINLYPDICYGQSYFAGGANRTISGIFYDTLQSVNSFDSIIVTHLNVRSNFGFSSYHNICQGDSFYFRGSYLTSTGIYTDSLKTIYGCDSIFITNLTVYPNPTTPVITANGVKLESTLALFYQWYLNGNKLTGDTSRIYSPLQSGSYTVEITDSNGCKSTSIIYDYVYVSIKEFSEKNSILLIPNPAKHTTIISIPEYKNSESGVIEISNINGKLLKSITIKQNQIQLDLDEFSEGIYFVKYISTDKVYVNILVIN